MKKLLLIALISICCFGCGKATDNVPSVGVNYTGQLFSPPLNKLSNGGPPQFIGGYGVAGLVIYKSIQGNYVAYDRCSSYQPEKNVQLLPMIPALHCSTHAAAQNFRWRMARR